MSRPASRDAAEVKAGLHPRNPHRHRYDFARLIAASPELAPFVSPNAYGDASVDFADPAAVRALNRAILLLEYDIRDWDIPAGYLCPPIPGRADYLHHLADLLAEDGGDIPRRVRALDIGTGANCVYPLIGQRSYGWQFVGTDIDPAALANAQRVLEANGLGGAITLRLQASRQAIFRGVVQPGEAFDVTLCNPPFHASQAEAGAGTQRKWNNLGRESAGKPQLNFGGQGAELWCPGGEQAFICRMIEESRQVNACWFTTLVSKSASLPAVYRALERAGVQEVRTIGMAQGQKQSRIVAWSFRDAAQRRAWRQARRA
ncbi:MAG: 23S rRNA (adenine(1618)-N(6))-methyltransferase RlmF [Gallionella sp.]|nr:23S rRNA (adenine(1618)-N(6))-methyltransferase RlmF [Gallionella sp.]MDD4946337.1 23S rRNA (adenine(1618)-N(6))-methyltransferase RlmF [Gallionella sp.]MDD5611912.1 23S rRNA (adenine(1618)-N(6))-methyltransferase RlmF [Gallionella sp.]